MSTEELLRIYLQAKIIGGCIGLVLGAAIAAVAIWHQLHPD